MFFDAYFCNNFNFKMARYYEKAGYDVSNIHFVLFGMHYRNLHLKVLRALEYDLRLFSYSFAMFWLKLRDLRVEIFAEET